MTIEELSNLSVKQLDNLIEISQKFRKKKVIEEKLKSDMEYGSLKKDEQECIDFCLRILGNMRDIDDILKENTISNN